MSFILDALKKSETERQQQSSAEFSNVPTSADEPRGTRWLWLLGLLLLVNFAALIILLLTASPGDGPGAADPEAEAPASFEEQVAVARDNRARQATPVVAETSPATASAEPAGSPVEAASAGGKVTVDSSRRADGSIPTMDELRLDGSLQLAPLHLDIHVFSEQPAERFVFINMNKHREGSRIAEGPLVREIRPDGVVLEHQGRAFLLPRQ